MTTPFIHIATYTIKEGKLQGFKESLPGFFQLIEANEPRLLAINAYVDEEGTEATIIQVHPDAAWLEQYFKIAHEHTDRAFGQFVEANTSIQVYGEPSNVVLQRTRQHARSGVTVIMKPDVGGFTRPQTAG